jgi:hypothetical protein
MPRVAGLNIVAVLIAAVAFYAVGMVIYGFAVTEVWSQHTLINHGMAPDQASALKGEELMAAVMAIPNAMGPAMAYGLGFLVALVTTTGIALVLNMTRPASLGGALQRAFVLWLCFAATTLSYNVLYSSESRTIFAIDLVHLFVAYHLAASVLFLLDRKALSGAAAPAAA